MTITFKCSCGNGMSVPDSLSGREAFCPVCRKKLPVPGASLEPASSAAPDQREASEFRPGALAKLLASGAPAPEPPGDQPAAPAPAAVPAEKSEPLKENRPVPAPAVQSPAPAEVGSAPPPSRGVQLASADNRPAPPPGVEVFPDKIKFHCECGQKVAVKLPAPHSAGKCPRCGRSLKIPDVRGGAAKEAAGPKDKRAPKEMLRCPKCGRRIEDAAAAFCPRCGFALALPPPAPSAGGDESKGPPPLPPAAGTPPPVAGAGAQPGDQGAAGAAGAASAEVRKRSARQAAEAAADLLRPPGARDAFGAEPACASLPRRLAAFLLDLAVAAAVALVAWKLSDDAGIKPSWHGAVAGLGAFLVLNEVLFAAAAGGRSLGMVVFGVAVFSSAGRPAGLLVLAIRLAAWVVLIIGAPWALFEPQRRALHDLICGTTVRQTAKG